MGNIGKMYFVMAMWGSITVIQIDKLRYKGETYEKY